MDISRESAALSRLGRYGSNTRLQWWRAALGSAAESETEEQGSSVFDLTIERRCQRSTMKGVGEEEAPTATMETVPLELVLRNPLVGEGGSGSASTRTRNAYNLRLAPPVHSGFSTAISSRSFSSIYTFPWLFCAYMTR